MRDQITFGHLDTQGEPDLTNREHNLERVVREAVCQVTGHVAMESKFLSFAVIAKRDKRWTNISTRARKKITAKPLSGRHLDILLIPIICRLELLCPCMPGKFLTIMVNLCQWYHIQVTNIHRVTLLLKWCNLCQWAIQACRCTLQCFILNNISLTTGHRNHILIPVLEPSLLQTLRRLKKKQLRNSRQIHYHRCPHGLVVTIQSAIESSLWLK